MADVDSRKEVIDLLKDLQSHYGTYHNHKENVGWAGVALYAVLIVGIANVLRQLDLSCLARVGASLLVIGVSVVCGLYMAKQFQLRTRAADLVAACIQLRSGVVSTPNIAIVASDWAPPTQSFSGGMQSTHVLPQVVLKVAGEMSSAGQSSRRWLERCAYAIIVGLAISLLIAIWATGRDQTLKLHDTPRLQSE